MSPQQWEYNSEFRMYCNLYTSHHITEWMSANYFSANCFKGFLY